MTEQEIITVVKAFLGGEQIQIKLNGDDVFDNWSDISAPAWDFSRYSYRVKPKPNIGRPYTYEELKGAVRKHGNMIICPAREEEVLEHCTVISGFNRVQVKLDFDERYLIDIKSLVDFVWLDDGSPCGIVEDEKVQV